MRAPPVLGIESASATTTCAEPSPPVGDPGRLVISRDDQVLVVEAGAARCVGIPMTVSAPGSASGTHGGGRPEGAFAGSAVTVGHIENDLVAVVYQGGAVRRSA